MSDDFLRHWETNMGPPRAQVAESLRGAREYAIQAIKSSALLNGGGLIAVPTFVGAGLAIGVSYLVAGASFFVLGLLATSLAYYFAFRTMLFAAEAAHHDSNRIASDMHAGISSTDTDRLVHQTSSEDAERERQRSNSAGQRAQLRAVIFYFISVGYFVAGAAVVLLGGLITSG